MATYHKFLITLLCIVAILSASISAVDFTVGDDNGWSINNDYQAWAKGKKFQVGDNLVFKYPEGVHNVVQVNGTDFAQCAAKSGGIKTYTTGNDAVLLKGKGTVWFICSFGQHCAVGNQKLTITVS